MNNRLRTRAIVSSQAGRFKLVMPLILCQGLGTRAPRDITRGWLGTYET